MIAVLIVAAATIGTLVGAFLGAVYGAGVVVQRIRDYLDDLPELTARDAIARDALAKLVRFLEAPR